MPCFPYDEAALAHLRAADPRMEALVNHLGRVERPVIPDLFEALVHSVVNQQISTKAAKTVWSRLCAAAGEITPQRLLAMSEAEIQGCGLSFRKVGYIKGIAGAIEDGIIQIDEIARMSDGEVVKALCALPGVGVWTAEMLLIQSLMRPDVVSFGDLGIRRGMMRLYALDSLSKEQFDQIRTRYSPYGSVASLYLWELSHMDELALP